MQKRIRTLERKLATAETDMTWYRTQHLRGKHELNFYDIPWWAYSAGGFVAGLLVSVTIAAGLATAA